MKLCVDCQLFIQNGSKCGRSTAPDPVRGMPQNKLAIYERTMPGADYCGPEAKFFRIIPVAAAA